MNAHWGFMGGGLFGGLLWVAVVVVVVLLFWRLIANREGTRRGDDSPEAILKRRYARGEIDREQYERMLEDLRR